MEERLTPTAHRVLDINQLPDQQGSGLGVLGTYNGALYFTASVPGYGRELWKTDGTKGGTALVKDINPGLSDSNPANFQVVNGLLFFTAKDSSFDIGLWRSDGTTDGTVLVKPLDDGPTYFTDAENLTRVNDTLFFTAIDADHGKELWKSDGTEAGTVLVKDINPGAEG